MKNRVILNGQGVPVVPKSDKIANDVANSDLRREVKTLALKSFSQGINCGIDAMKLAFEESIKAGHDVVTLGDCLKLLEELRKMVKSRIDQA